MLGEKLDEIFADFSDSTPGCSVGVIRSGEIVAARGYGQAQLEYGLPIVADGTIFHVASVSKQFTAFAVTLLSFERPEILQLDDPVSKHLPWLPELGSSVTVRQMMHHTSGIRDQWELLVMGGWRMDDVLTTDMILNLMRRQRELNFPPGSEYMYCNMGYLLLAQVVETVSGVSFAAFCDQRIFGPLRMTRTHIHDDHERIVPGRAYSYKPAGENRFKKAILSYANAGATSLFTTATDLLFWLDNFRTATVGGHAVMSAMTSLGVLTSGETIDYAHGVTVTEHRGLQVIGHSGADAGFRAQVLWQPDHELGVVVLSNYSIGNPGARATKVLEAALGDAAFSSPRLIIHAAATLATGVQGGERPLEETVPASLARRICGDYYSAELGTHYTIASSPASSPAGCKGEDREMFLTISQQKRGSMLLRAVQWRWSTEAEGAERSPSAIEDFEFLISSSREQDLGQDEQPLFSQFKCYC